MIFYHMLQVSLPENPSWTGMFGADASSVAAICVELAALYVIEIVSGANR